MRFHALEGKPCECGETLRTVDVLLDGTWITTALCWHVVDLLLARWYMGEGNCLVNWMDDP
jgi:hypothetical protein